MPSIVPSSFGLAHLVLKLHDARFRRLLRPAQYMKSGISRLNNGTRALNDGPCGEPRDPGVKVKYPCIVPAGSMQGH